MKQYPPEKIRNVGIIGSGTTGKTSLSEALLFKTGAISRQGSVTEGNTTSDYDPEEIKRGISIHSTLLPLEWKEHKINLIDTPGFIDFVGDAISTMRVVDSLIIVVDAVTGHGTALENLWKLADKFDLPRIIVINKMDKSQADFDKIIETLRKKFSREIVPVQIPVGTGANFSGMHSLLKHEVPDNLKDSAAKYKEMLIEGVAEIDDTILTEYLENKEITEDELKEHLITALDHDKIFPVFCMSATKNIGAEELLDAIVSWMPPANEKEIPAKNGVKVKPDAKEPFSAYVFKTVSEAHIGNLTYIRVYSGTIKPSSPILNSSKGKDERIGQIISMRGKTKVGLPLLSAGDIAVLPKLKITATGDTLCDKSKSIIFDSVEYPEPAMSFAVKPTSVTPPDIPYARTLE